MTGGPARGWDAPRDRQAPGFTPPTQASVMVAGSGHIPGLMEEADAHLPVDKEAACPVLRPSWCPAAATGPQARPGVEGPPSTVAPARPTWPGITRLLIVGARHAAVSLPCLARANLHLCIRGHPGAEGRARFAGAYIRSPGGRWGPLLRACWARTLCSLNTARWSGPLCEDWAW